MQETEEDLVALDDRYVIKSWSRKSNAPVVVGGKGIYFWDTVGKRHMDFASQLVNVNAGFGHSKIIEAIKKQAEELAYVSGVYRSIPAIKLAKRLSEIMPPNLIKTFFCTSGGNAVESALKIARQYTKRSKVIAMYTSYHGSTFGTLSATGIAHAKNHLEPLLPGFIHVPPPDSRHPPFGNSGKDVGEECANYIEKVIEWEGPETISAFVAEPIISNQFLVPPTSFWPKLRELCDKYGIMLIFDEVLTGYGRTGKMFACNHYDTSPDILVTGKGITSGYLPLSAVTVSKQLGEFLDNNPYVHGFTYAAHPMCCAAGLAGIQVVLEDNLIENSNRVGAYLLKRLRELQSSHSCIEDARGIGLLNGVEVKDKKTAVYIRTKASEEGLEIGFAPSFAPSILRIVPPLCVTTGEADTAISILDRVLKNADKDA